MAEEILANFESKTASLTLVPGDGGQFEIQINGDPIYSKLQTGRHIEVGEATRLIHNYLENG
nr:Rdx family protein [Anaerolineae bacterium]